MHAFTIFTPRCTDWTQPHKVTTTGTRHITHQHELEAQNFCKDPYCIAHR
jgi:hypothetical protein